MVYTCTHERAHSCIHTHNATLEMNQMFDIIAEGALKPFQLCHLLHLCNGTGSDTHLPALFGPSWGAKLRGGGRSSASERDHTHPVSEGRLKMASGLEGGKENTFTFLHLSDIHLDRQYSEV